MAGRPVLVSRAIPMAEYVEQTGCGVIVENVDAQSILRALDELTAHYPQLREAARHVDRETFSLDRLAYHQLYRDVAHGPR
jgi:glycosyltransferase involved in cell wall biosynthesis